MSYKIISYYQIKSRDVPSVVHPFLTNMYLRKFHIKRMLEEDKVLVVERIPKSDSVLDHFGKVRNDVPFSLRCHLRNIVGESGLRFGSLGGSRNRVAESDAQYIVSEFAKIPPLSASVVEYEKKYSASKNMTQVKSPTIEEMLETPELDSVSSVNLDPASMLADDVDSFIKEGSRFVENPSLEGAAMMAVIAIPGKVLDDMGGRLIQEAAKRNPTKQINGRKVLNSDMAGKAVETKGGEVWFDFDGFPDFTPYAEKIVKVEDLTGNRNQDSKAALKALGIDSYNQKDMVWHHHQDGVSMMLIPKDVHSIANGGVAHTGGSAIIKHNQLAPELKLTYPSPTEIK